MTPEQRDTQAARRQQLEIILDATREAVREALRRHMLLGESVAVAEKDGTVRILTPDEIRKALDAT